MATPATSLSAPSRKPPRRKRKTQGIAYIYLLPTLLTIGILSLGPILYTIYISFTNYDSGAHFLNYSWVGFSNYTSILFGQWGPYFLPTIAWTFIFAVLTTVFNYLLGLIMAVFLNNRHMKESVFYRGILIIPWAVPALASQLAWSAMLDYNHGNINQLLHYVGLGPVPWLLNPFWAKVAILLVNLWLGYPYMMNVALGGLQAIPSDIYEAASIDGANARQQFFYVTLPSLWRISLPLIIPTIAFNFNNFGAVYLLTQGNPASMTNQFAGSTDILISAIYKMLDQLAIAPYGLISALAVLAFIVVAVFSYVNMRLTHAFEEVD